MTNAPSALGMIHFALRRATNMHWQALDVDKAHARVEQKNQKPAVLWFTGLSGSGKSTIANIVEKRCCHGRHTYLLDGDNVRHGLNKDLGFTDADRVENIRRVAEVAKLMTDAGLITLVSFISPFRSERRMARDLMEDGEFIEVFVDTPLEVCREARRERPLQEGARRRDQELHRHRFALRAAGKRRHPIENHHAGIFSGDGRIELAQIGEHR
jgi:bifunctional enzyme CysN/CysC